MFKKLLFSRETYHIIFTWTLAWYSFWIVIKHQINVINIGGAIVSAGIIVSGFQRGRNAVTRSSNFARPKVNKNIHMTNASSGSQINKEIQKLPTTFATQNQTLHFTKIVNSPEQTTIASTQKQEPESNQTEKKSQQSSSNANGCPKNLDYFTQKPRPKQMPEECFTCRNLITCVCATGN